VLTNSYHSCHSEHFQKAFGCPVVSCHHAGLCEFAGGQEEEEEVVEGLSFGEEVARLRTRTTDYTIHRHVTNRAVNAMLRPPLTTSHKYSPSLLRESR
jgi:hypothetical protein